MKNKIAMAAMLAVLPVGASLAASNNVGCGVGTMIFEGQSGVAPQVLAVTTNGTLGNQTFGISSGTVGCATDGVVSQPAKVAMFIDTNLDKLAYDMAVGQGEALESLANLIGVQDADKKVFFETVKAHYGEIIASARMDTQDVMTALNSVLARSDELAQYARLV